MVSAIVAGAVGVLATWVVAHFYYKRADAQLPRWADKELVHRLKDVLVKNPGDVDWTAEQVIKLYNQMIFNGDREKSISNIRFCAHCGSGDLDLIAYDADLITALMLKCRCGWRAVGKELDDYSEIELRQVREQFGELTYQWDPERKFL